MSDGDILFTFVALLFVGWVCYGVGKRVGFAKKKADLSKANQADDRDNSPLNRHRTD